MEEDSEQMVKKRGRPPLEAGTVSAPVSTSLPLPTHDRLLKLASIHRKNVSELMREAVTDYLLRDEAESTEASTSRIT